MWDGDWVLALRLYLLVVLLANLLWEAAQLPLYTIWKTATPHELAVAALHCTGGDVLIALTSLVVALVLIGHRAWPDRNFWRVAALTVIIGVGYTIFSEWLNIVVRGSWAYSPLMPVIPVVEVGLSPFLQWIVIPAGGLAVARRCASIHWRTSSEEPQ